MGAPRTGGWMSSREPGSDTEHRLQCFGVEHLSDLECLSLLLSTRRPGASVSRLCERLIERLGGLGGLEAASYSELRTVPGLGAARAMRLLSAFDLSRRTLQSKWLDGRLVSGPAEVAQLLRARTRRLRRESFQVVALDARHRVRGVHTVSIGHLSGAPVHPREVFLEAIERRAHAVVVAHNHPSGDPTPSLEDRRVTDRLREVGELLGVEVLDHLVLGRSSFYSFAEEAERPFSPASSRAHPTSAAVSTRSVRLPS